MTREEIAKISELQKAGMGYKRIAALTNIPANTVKSYCRRHPVAKSGVCRQCGAPISQTPHKRVKKYCSDACRMIWWKTHPEQVHRKIYHLTCIYCGEPFDSADAKRQYCSRVCYADARRRKTLP